jgi:hypothetical protein
MTFTLFHTEKWSMSRVQASYPEERLRQMSADKFEKIKLLIVRYKVVVPPVINRRNGKMLDGYTRSEAAFALGYNRIDVTIVDLDDRDEIALMTALNNLESDWVDDELALDLSQLVDAGIAPVAGFTDTEVSLLLQRLSSQSTQSTQSAASRTDSYFQPEIIASGTPEVVVIPKQPMKGGSSTVRYVNFRSPDAEFTCRAEDYEAFYASLPGDTPKQKSIALAQRLGIEGASP